MENTEKILFENDMKPQWFVALGERWLGPLSASDIYEKILAQQLTWAHYVWREGQDGWMRICDIAVFQAAVPLEPPKELQGKIRGIVSPVVKQGARAVKSAPPPPPKAEQDEIQADSLEKKWFLFYSETQFGPFSREEVERLLRIGKIHGGVHVWCEGMNGWERLERTAGFKEVSAESWSVYEKRRAEKKGAEPAKQPRPEPPRAAPVVEPPIQAQNRMFAKDEETSPIREKLRDKFQKEQLQEIRENLRASLKASSKDALVDVSKETAKGSKKDKPGDQRGSPRKPLVAKLFLANEETLVTAVCRDISVGGMQVLTDRIPGITGTRLKMNVSPVGGGRGSIRPFVAEGVIVRILEDGRGFSFRFEKLTQEAKQAIEKYIRIPG